MASRSPMDQARPGDILLVVHDFTARSIDELSLARGDRVELIERDDDFGDGWFLGKHLTNGNTGLFPEVYTTPAPKGTLTTGTHRRTVIPSMTNALPAVQEQQAGPGASPGPTTSAGSPVSVRQATAKSSSSSIRSSDSPVTARSSMPASANSPGTRTSIPSAAPRSMSLASGGMHSSPVMNETLSVINEHITDMHTPRHSLVGSRDRRATNDSGSEYSSHIGRPLSYINGHETDEEEQVLHTEQEVMAWSPKRVAEYLEDAGVEKRHCEIFQEQEITGEVLLGMDQSSIFLREFDLGPVGRRLRTWHKIKALQQEVKSVSAAPSSVSEYSTVEDMNVDQGRNRSTSLGTVLPRIPSLMESSTSRGSVLQHAQRPSSQIQTNGQEGPPTLATIPATPEEEEAAPRPSAASVRSMNHSRRHSSIDSIASPQTPRSATFPKPASPAQTSHKKQVSLDRSWTMTGQGFNRSWVIESGSQTPPMNGRPSSAQYTHALSATGTKFDTSTQDTGMSPVSPEELERGYFSGGDIDNQKARNVLKKRESPTYIRTSSYTSEQRRRSAKHTRAESSDSIRDSVAPITSPAAKIYFSLNTKKPSRAVSGPELSKTLVSAKDLPPTVTKLDYSDSPSIDAIATSPKVAESDTSSMEHAPLSPAVQSQSAFSKPRATGLRAISDAITGNEKALVSSDKNPSPVKESPLQSPTRTGSSTPSGTSKSFDYEDSSTVKSATGSSGGLTPTSGTTRRKSKKSTSAYTRGLEKKTPQEQMLGCDYSGWMKKKSSNLMTTWKPRLFVLRGRRLSYYYTENDTEEKGLIDISSHRVLPADTERLTGLHATLTGASASPTSPQNAQTPTAAATDAAAAVAAGQKDPSGIFIFKLVPPRSGLSKAVNFTKPTVHYFAVDSVQHGRLWMAALMKATIDRDETMDVKTTYNQKTISLAKAKAMRQRPPALRDLDEEAAGGGAGGRTKGLGLVGLGDGKGEGEGQAVDGAGRLKGGKVGDDGVAGADTVPLPASNAGSLNEDVERKEVMA